MNLYNTPITIEEINYVLQRYSFSKCLQITKEGVGEYKLKCSGYKIFDTNRNDYLPQEITIHWDIENLMEFFDFYTVIVKLSGALDEMDNIRDNFLKALGFGDDARDMLNLANGRSEEENRVLYWKRICKHYKV